VFWLCQIKKGSIVHILENVFGSVAFGIGFGGPRAKFHGDFISSGCGSIVFNEIFQGRIELQYPKHNEESL
jgi:hypothetical protein